MDTKINQVIPRTRTKNQAHYHQYFKKNQFIGLVGPFLIHISEAATRGVKSDVLKNFANFTEKHQCWSLILLKLQTFRPATLLKRDANTGDYLVG